MSDSTRLPGNIVFIRLPESMHRSIGDFEVDPAIPLPLVLGRDASVQDSLQQLSWEMLVAGMLRVLAYQKDHEHADYFRQFIAAVKPDIFAELSQTGIMMARNKNYEVAEEVFLALHGLQPEAAWPLINLAVLRESQADALEQSGKDALAETIREKVFSLYKTLLAMDTVPADVYFNAGFFFLAQRGYERAAEMFETYRSVGDDPVKLEKAGAIAAKLADRHDRDQLFKTAFDLIRLGREEEALVQARRFLELDPEVWNGWFLLGWALRRLGRYQDGREAFLKALNLGGQQVDLYNELAICEMELGLLDDSRQHLELALRKEPENIKILSNLGILALRQQRQDEAAGFFRTVLDLDPKDSLALQQLELLEAGGY